MDKQTCHSLVLCIDKSESRQCGSQTVESKLPVLVGLDVIHNMPSSIQYGLEGQPHSQETIMFEGWKKTAKPKEAFVSAKGTR